MGSAWRRVNGTEEKKKLLSSLPIDFPDDYRKWINLADNEEELLSLRASVNKGIPYGQDAWVDTMINKFKLHSTTRNPGRPRRIMENNGGCPIAQEE